MNSSCVAEECSRGSWERERKRRKRRSGEEEEGVRSPEEVRRLRRAARPPQRVTGSPLRITLS